MSFPLRVIHDLRPALPWTIYSLPIKIESGPDAGVYEHRFAILWDEDNDERVHAAVLDVFFRHPETLLSMYAVGERKGSLTIWAAVFPVADQNAWAFASRHPAIQDEWPVSGINLNQEIMRTGALKNLDPMDWDKVHRKFPPAHDQLNWLINLFNLGPTGPRLPW
jgi:hypothetical protein